MNWKTKFYNSKAWRQTRALVVSRDESICRMCGGIIVGAPHVHHTVELNESNYRDAGISLNLDLLETLHHECHDRRHGRFGVGEKVVIVDDELNVDYTKRTI
jgi:5-methylcytosine-specific restriction endonuclease McrA